MQHTSENGQIAIRIHAHTMEEAVSGMLSIEKHTSLSELRILFPSDSAVQQWGRHFPEDSEETRHRLKVEITRLMCDDDMEIDGRWLLIRFFRASQLLGVMPKDISHLRVRLYPMELSNDSTWHRVMEEFSKLYTPHVHFGPDVEDVDLHKEDKLLEAICEAKWQGGDRLMLLQDGCIVYSDLLNYLRKYTRNSPHAKFRYDKTKVKGISNATELNARIFWSSIRAVTLEMAEDFDCVDGEVSYRCLENDWRGADATPQTQDLYRKILEKADPVFFHKNMIYWLPTIRPPVAVKRFIPLILYYIDRAALTCQIIIGFRTLFYLYKEEEKKMKKELESFLERRDIRNMKFAGHYLITINPSK